MRRYAFYLWLLSLVFVASSALALRNLLSVAITTSREYKEYKKAMESLTKYIKEGDTVQELVPGGKRKAINTALDSIKYLDEIIGTLEEFASYFGFWKANLHAQIGDQGKVREILTEIALKYQESEAGKIAREILKEKNAKSMLALFSQKFSSLPNPMETTPEEKNLHRDSLRNKLRFYLKQMKAYKDWLAYDQMLARAKNKEEIKELLRRGDLCTKMDNSADAVMKEFDEEISARFVEKGGQLTIVNLDPDFPEKEKFLKQSLACYKSSAERFPKTIAAKLAKTVIEESQSR